MNRAATLEALVKISMPISEAISRLAEFPWDSESELVILTPEDFCHVLSSFKRGSLSAAEVEDWANALECRDDVGFATSQARELLHELANPLLTQPLSGERADFWLSQLCSSSPEFSTWVSLRASRFNLVPSRVNTGLSTCDPPAGCMAAPSSTLYS